MERSLINELAESVAVSGGLSKESLNKVLKMLSRDDLKLFIRLLSKEIKDKTVNAVYAGEMSEENKKKITALFPDKTIVFNRNDEAIVAGAKFEYGDFVLDYSVSGAVKRILNDLRERI